MRDTETKWERRGKTQQKKVEWKKFGTKTERTEQQKTERKQGEMIYCTRKV